MPASSPARISSPLKEPRSAKASRFSASNAAFAWLAMFATCDLSVPTLVTSCATIRWVRRIDGRLHMIADHPRAAPAGRHRAGIRIGEGDLLIERGKHHFLNRF